MNKLSIAFLAIALWACNFAFAGTAVLGFEVGVSTLEQVNSTLAKKTNVSDSGINRYSNGPMLKTDGASYEIEGLNEVVYIFDDQKKLMGVVMGMNKNRFDAISQYLSGKYKVAAQERPFVGNQFARFKTPDSVIEISAPHLSIEMDVKYLRNDLLQKFNAQSQAELASKKRNEAAKF